MNIVIFIPLLMIVTHILWFVFWNTDIREFNKYGIIKFNNLSYSDIDENFPIGLMVIFSILFPIGLFFLFICYIIFGIRLLCYCITNKLTQIEIRMYRR